MNNETNVPEFYVTQQQNEYENSHKERFDFLIEDLQLNTFSNKLIADIGCGYGPIYNRLIPEIQKNYHGYDGANLEKLPFPYEMVDLDNFKTYLFDVYDAVLCFETLEHLTNPYNCLIQIKNMLKNNGLLFLSIPHENTLHNTIYPSLLYPKENFIEFLKQLAFEVISVKYHNKNFHQNVFILRNKDWNFSEMKWYKDESKFRNIPPHISVNL